MFLGDVPAHGFFAPVIGRVKIFRTSPAGKEQILHIFGPGEAVGEVPVFQGGTFPANGQALEKLETLFSRAKTLNALSERTRIWP